MSLISSEHWPSIPLVESCAKEKLECFQNVWFLSVVLLFIPFRPLISMGSVETRRRRSKEPNILKTLKLHFCTELNRWHQLPLNFGITLYYTIIITVQLTLITIKQMVGITPYYTIIITNYHCTAVLFFLILILMMGIMTNISLY